MLSNQALAVIGNCARNGGVMNMCRRFSVSSQKHVPHYELVIIGGGAGGCSISNVFGNRMKTAVIEPHHEHYYQPMWTLVGSGKKDFSASARPMQSVLNKNADWIRDRAVEFCPKDNTVIIGSGEQIKYDFLVIAPGIQLHYDWVEGLEDAMKTPNVGSNYSRLYVHNTLSATRSFRGGNAIFTLPNTPIKCPGAPQKIMYLCDDYWTQNGLKDKTNLMFNTSLGVIFGVKKYANTLTGIAATRECNINFRTNLIKVEPGKKEATFEKLDSESNPKETFTVPYGFLHAVPPQAPPDCVRKNADLADQNGWLNLNKDTLQHVKFDNIFGIGDCTNLPTSRTAAAVACEIGIIRKNLKKVVKGRTPKAVYDGYTSCPLLVGNNRCVFAEFDYEGKPLETFPFNQGKPRLSMFLMKKEIIPIMYYYMMLKGYWEGPGTWRKVFHFGRTVHG